jgi:hypothetical protein
VAEKNLRAIDAETRGAGVPPACAYLKRRTGRCRPNSAAALRARAVAPSTLVWGRLALQLADNMRQKLLRARLSRKLSPRQLADLYPTTVRRNSRPRSRPRPRPA